MTRSHEANAACVERCAALLQGLAVRPADGPAAARDGLPTFEVPREDLHAALERLKLSGGFAQCTLVTAVDRYPAEPRFEVVWQLLDHQRAERVRVRTRVGTAEAWVPSSVDLWPGANWSERECYDMFGIEFRGHPDLRRLLMPEGYDHHPLRKDFPHRGLEPDRLYREWDRARRAPASLE